MIHCCPVVNSFFALAARKFGGVISYAMGGATADQHKDVGIPSALQLSTFFWDLCVTI